MDSSLLKLEVKRILQMKVLIANAVSDITESNLYHGLKLLGVDLHLIVEPNDPGISSYVNAGIPTEILHIKNRFDPKAVRFISNKLKQEKFDIIYAPTSRTISTTLFATNRQGPKLVTYRGTMGRLSYFSPLSWLSHLNPRVSAIVCNCEAVKTSLLRTGVAEEKLPVIYKGHNAEWYQSKNEFDYSKLGIHGNTIISACVANVRKKKGLDVLLKAISRLPKDLQICFLIIGSIKDRSFEKMAEDLGVSSKVKFLGFRSDALELISGCDFTVMPSLAREGVPRSMMESMAQGIPVVVTTVGGMPEVVVHGDNGLLIPAGDDAAFAKGILDFCQNPEARSAMGKRAAERIKSKFNPEQHAKGFFDLFNKLLSE